MFDTMQVARTIRDARISRNMTQMNLADAMEVSYQAVSNWERGNSMPDIAKLEQLCQILGIGIEELLGTDSPVKTIQKVMGSPSPAVTNANATHGSSAITKTVYKDNIESAESHGELPADDSKDASPITVKELCSIAPLLPPTDIEALVENNMTQGEGNIDFSSIVALAPFLDTQYLDQLVRRASIGSLKEITCIAPFLSSGALDALVMGSDLSCDMNGLISLAPFLSRKTLDSLALDILHVDSLIKLTGLAPFLSKETLNTLIERADPECDMSGIVSLAPFLSRETLDSLALDKLHVDSLLKLAGLAPFLSRETLDTLIERSDPECDLPGITALAPFLSRSTLDNLVGKLMASGISSSRLSCLFPFLSQSTLRNIAESLMQKKDLAALKHLAPFI